MPDTPSASSVALEKDEKDLPDETAQIDNIAGLTVEQLESRYGAAPPFLRGVHPKDHGCLEATFTVSRTLEPQYRVGVFRKPGQRFRAAIRFSNASALVTPDSQEMEPDGTLKTTPDGKPLLAHLSRGMAVKLYDVGGNRLVPDDGERTQDFLMINQPVFAFANVEDYEQLSLIIVEDGEKPDRFFHRMGDTNEKVRERAKKSFDIVRQVKSLTAPPPPLRFPFQAPPLSPFDNIYFSAAPFLFGEGRAMKFSARPVNPVSGELGDIADPDYLRKALRKRMAEAGGKDICFDFQIQVRKAEDLNLDLEIEDMCTLWEEEGTDGVPFVTVARITIPPQDVASPERQKFCETLFYTPWHGLDDHRPLGGINRMRRKVYEASSKRRGCPVSPDLPPAKRQP